MFLRRVVLYLVALGIDQFLDLGSGIPTVGNVHEVAQTVNPRARVVYVDHDPVAVTHSRALLRGNDRATAIAGDIREPARVLEDAVATGLLDLAGPVAVLFIAVLHFIGRRGSAGRAGRRVHGRDRAGQLSGGESRDAREQPGVLNAAKVYDRSRSPNAMRFRSRAEIEALFGDLTVVDPGCRAGSAVAAGTDR